MSELMRWYDVISEIGYPPSEFPKLGGNRGLVGEVESDDPDATPDAGDVCELTVDGVKGVVTVLHLGILSYEAHEKNLRACEVQVEPVSFPSLRDRRLVFRLGPKPQTKAARQ